MKEKLLLELKDGGIESIDTDERVYPGCPTCDYGSEYINEFRIHLTGHTIYAETNQMYEFAFSSGDLMEIILPNIKQIINMTEDDFIQWFKTEVFKRDENAKFKVN